MFVAIPFEFEEWCSFEVCEVWPDVGDDARIWLSPDGECAGWIAELSVNQLEGMDCVCDDVAWVFCVVVPLEAVNLQFQVVKRCCWPVVVVVVVVCFHSSWGRSVELG